MTNKAPKSSFIFIILSIMLFLQFWIWGAWYISIPKYLSTVEGMKDHLHFCYEAIPLAAIIAPFFLGLIADRFFNTEKVLAILFFLAGIFIVAIPFVANIQGEITKENIEQISFLGMSGAKHSFINAFIMLHSLCFMPTLALTASLSFHHLPKASKQFPYVRLWGTFGWIFAGLLLVLFNTTAQDGTTIAGESKPIQFYIAAIAAFVLAVLCFFLPKTPAPKKGEKIDIRSLFFMDVWKYFKNKNFLVFILCSFALSIPLQAYYAYLQTQMGVQGFKNFASWKNAGTWLEAFMLFIMPFFFVRLGVKKMILIGIGAWIFRYVCFAIAAQYGVIENISISNLFPLLTSMPFVLILSGILVHGICYDFFFITGNIYVDQATDKDTRAQAQSLFVFFTQGLGMYLGAKINQHLIMNSFKVETIGDFYAKSGSKESIILWQNFWFTLAIIAVVVFICFALFFKHKDEKNKEFNH